MPKLYMYSGLPASGKSTKAKQTVANHSQTARINRDSLREMLFNGKWTGNREKIVVEAEKALADVLFKNNHSVIIDDTNLTQKHEDLWRRISSGYSDVSFEKVVLDTPIEECIRRDKYRQSLGLPFVGQNTIIKMALKNGLIEWPDKDIVIFDVDGTLANGSNREKYLDQKPKDWKTYFSLLGEDEPYEHIFRWMYELSKDYTVLIVSGRPADYEYETINWFEKQWEPKPLFPELEIPRTPVFLYLFRDRKDSRPDYIVKKEILDLIPKDRVKLVVDDRLNVIQMWKENGLFCIPVRGTGPEVDF